MRAASLTDEGYPSSSLLVKPSDWQNSVKFRLGYDVLPSKTCQPSTICCHAYPICHTRPACHSQHCPCRSRLIPRFFFITLFLDIFVWDISFFPPVQSIRWLRNISARTSSLGAESQNCLATHVDFEGPNVFWTVTLFAQYHSHSPHQETGLYLLRIVDLTQQD